MINGLTFTEDPHEYHLDGVRLPSVTEIIAEVGGACGLSPTYPVGNYRVRGQRVHQASALYDQGVLDQYEIGASIAPYIEGWKKAMVDFPMDWEKIEYQIYDPVLCVAGTTDRFGRNKARRRVVADIKSGKTGKETGLQLAGYVLMLSRLGLLGSDDPLDVVRIKFELSDEGNYKAVQYSNSADFTTWEALVRLYQWKRMK